jgi:hypothetical protein
MNPELMQTLMQNPEQGRELVQNMLAERAAVDPNIAMLMQMMSQRESEPDPAREPTVRRTTRVDRVRARVQDMRDELVLLRARNERLAAGLGACALCWGDDDDCTRCGGDGIPGWLDPDPIAFTELVAPAVTRLADTNPDAGDGA